MKILIQIFVFGCLFCVLECKGLREEFTWTRISYAIERTNPRYFKRKNEGVSAIDNNYIFENNVPMGANIWKDKLFITIPRRKPGIPSTLNYVPLNQSQKRHNVPLIPYPDLLTNVLNTNQKREHNFVSVYRLTTDACDRLWFVDTGLVNVLGNETKVKPKTLYVMDLNTDRVIRSYIFKDSVLKPTSALVNLEIDVEPNKCEEAFAYIPDLLGYGLVVYSYKENDSWRIDHDSFKYEEAAKQFNIGGLNFEWEDGIFSIALSQTKPDGFKDAYFHAMSATHMYRVSTEILKNRTLATRPDFQILGDRGKLSQTSASKLHQTTGVLFLGLVNQNALGCWNTNKPFKLDNFDVVHKDDAKMIYPSDVKIYADDVIVLTNKMPVFVYGKLNYEEVNFRVWIQNVGIAVNQTRCGAI